MCVSLAPVLSSTKYFHAPATQANASLVGGVQECFQLCYTGRAILAGNVTTCQHFAYQDLLLVGNTATRVLHMLMSDPESVSQYNSIVCLGRGRSFMKVLIYASRLVCKMPRGNLLFYLPRVKISYRTIP